MKALIVLLAALGASIANAGAISGGGGKGVVCRNPAGEIISATTLDLYEGKAVYGVNVPESNAPMNDQIEAALTKIPKFSAGVIVEAYVKTVLAGMKFVKGIELQPIDDALVVAIPRGCAAEQLANYYNDKRIVVNGDIWDKMSETARASLVLHEAVYANERIWRSTDSRRSRAVVANLLSPDTKWEDVNDGMPREYLTCFTGEQGEHHKVNWFFAYKSENEWHLNFYILNGNAVMSKKTASFRADNFDLQQAKDFPIEQGEDKIGMNWGETVQAVSAFESDDYIYLEKRYEAVTSKDGGKQDGLQMPNYYLSYTSANYPGEEFSHQRLNCSVQTNDQPAK
jgi:hypothetical protein